MCEHNADEINTCDRDKPESLMDHTCDHQMCRLCLRDYITTNIKSERITIKCPIKQCGGLVSYYDILRVDPSLADIYRDMIITIARRPVSPSSITQEDKELGMPVQCPQCHLWMYRNGGCAIIYCLCGFTFCSGCMMMYVGCRCVA